MSLESTVKAGIDVASLSALGAYMMGLAPMIATVFSAIWAVARFAEWCLEFGKKMGWIGKLPPPRSPFEPLD